MQRRSSKHFPLIENLTNKGAKWITINLYISLGEKKSFLFDTSFAFMLNIFIRVVSEEMTAFMLCSLKFKCSYLELAQPVSKLKEAQIKSPRPKPMVLTMGTTVMLPAIWKNTKQNYSIAKIFWF